MDKSSLNFPFIVAIISLKGGIWADGSGSSRHVHATRRQGSPEYRLPPYVSPLAGPYARGYKRGRKGHVTILARVITTS